jgi:hypothetical protein
VLVQIPAQIQEQESIKNIKEDTSDIATFSTDPKYKNKTCR